jgi:ankyrin repeat protein
MVKRGRIEMDRVYDSILKGDLEGFKELLLDNSIDPSVVNEKDEWGLTLLHWVAATGRQDAAKLLITMGADVNARSNNGWRPLRLAVESGNKELTSFLVENGACR